MQYGFRDAIASVGLVKFLSDLFWIGMFYHLYNQVVSTLWICWCYWDWICASRKKISFLPFWFNNLLPYHLQVATNTLERVAPLTHAVGNVLKRVFVIGFSIVVFGDYLSSSLFFTIHSRLREPLSPFSQVGHNKLGQFHVWPQSRFLFWLPLACEYVLYILLMHLSELLNSAGNKISTQTGIGTAIAIAGVAMYSLIKANMEEKKRVTEFPRASFF